MRRRKFFRIHLFGIVTVALVTVCMVWQVTTIRPGVTRGGEWLLLITYSVYLMCATKKARSE